MELDFSSENIDDQVGNYLENGEDAEVELEKENIVEELHNAVQSLLKHLNWIPNAKITNKEEEREKFIEKWNQGERYEPEFEFKNPDWKTSKALELLEKLEKETVKIDSSTMEKYGAKVITAEDFQKLFRDSFEEFRLWVNIIDGIEDRELWQELCLEVWPMVPGETVENSRKRLEEISFQGKVPEKNLTAEDVAKSFRQELEELGFEWHVEIRNVSGCHNIPEDRTVVVARGSGGERFYSEKELAMLTKHELFHVVRAYNGIKAGEESGLPPFLGLHTPFYDMTEEGGAVFREKKTGTFYPAKEFDYHLRLMAAYYMSEGLTFYSIVEKLVEHGGSLERSFSLAARNREVLRHHIYLGGLENWDSAEDITALLLGKVNPNYAEILAREAEAEGMISGPEIGAEKLLDEGQV